MALPSKSRPAEVEQELAKKVEVDKRQKMVFKISTDDVFYSRLSDWYNNLLKGKEKNRITPLRLKRQAMRICNEHGIAYGSLSANWVTRFLEEFGVTLREVKKKEAEAEPSTLELALVKKNRKRQSIEEAEAKKGEDGESVAEAGSSQSSKRGGVLEEKVLLDLRCAPPPPAWLKASAEGKPLPRFLTTYCLDETTTIMYYDYNPKLKYTDIHGREVVIEPQNCPIGSSIKGVF